MEEIWSRKQLPPNQIADWELRLGKFRRFQKGNQEMLIVSIEAVGFKVGNLLFIRRKMREL